MPNEQQETERLNSAGASLLNQRPARRDALPLKRNRDDFFKKLKRKSQVPKPKAKKRVYRRTIRLRPCARRAILLVPIGVLVIERYLGILLNLDHFTDFYYEQSGVEPWNVDRSLSQRIGAPPDLLNLTLTSETKCPHDLRKLGSLHKRGSYSMRSRKIPAIIHQTAESPCLTMNFYRAAKKWSSFRKWSYYFHDAEAMDMLLQSHFPEFPYLNIVVNNCVVHPSAKLDLWRFLVLWVYGGVIPDINSFPEHFAAGTIAADDDGFLLLDPKTNNLSTTLMALSPRHPLMYYAIQYSLENILLVDDISSVDSAQTTEKAVLKQAFFAFKALHDQQPSDAVEIPILVEGKAEGRFGRSLRISSTEGNYAVQVFISEQGKRKEFLKMGIETMMIQPRSVGNCFHEINANLGA